MPAPSSFPLATKPILIQVDDAETITLYPAGGPLYYGPTPDTATSSVADGASLALAADAFIVSDRPIRVDAIRSVATPATVAATVRRPLQWPGRPVVTNGMVQDATATLSNGTDTGQNTTRRHRAGVDLGLVRFVYYNGYNGTPGPNAITVSAGIETLSTGSWPNRPKWPVYFSGNRYVNIQPGGIAVSDPVSLDVVAGTTFLSRTFVQAKDAAGNLIAGGKWPLYHYPNEYGGWGEDSAVGATDVTITNAAGPTGSVAGYTPLAIVADDDNAAKCPCVAHIGDSIMFGSTNGTISFVKLALNDTVPYIVIPKSGETAQTFAAIGAETARKSLLWNATAAVCNYGINDFSSSRTAAQVANDVLTLLGPLARRGVKCFQTTITPKTTSTDSWATVANQTVFSGNAARVTFNNWLRAGAPIDPAAKTYATVGTVGALIAGQAGHPLSGYFEVADLVETARDSGKWTVGYTPDGLHPNAAGHTVLAAAVNVAALTA